jgi:NADP-dependent 3-hydroxy acid dehydrogenase YdfG
VTWAPQGIPKTCGTTAVTELASHNRPETLDSIQAHIDDIEWLQPEDIADAVSYIVTKPRRVAANEILVRPTDQGS